MAELGMEIQHHKILDKDMEQQKQYQIQQQHQVDIQLDLIQMVEQVQIHYNKYKQQHLMVGN